MNSPAGWCGPTGIIHSGPQETEGLWFLGPIGPQEGDGPHALGVSANVEQEAGVTLILATAPQIHMSLLSMDGHFHSKGD